MKVVAVKGKQVPLKWTETSEGLLEWLHDPEVPFPFPVEIPFSSDASDEAGKGSLISSYEACLGILWMWRDPCTSPRVETGMSGNFFSCSKAVKDTFDVPEFR